MVSLLVMPVSYSVILNPTGLMLMLNAGAALAVKNWAWQLTHPEGEPLTGETPYANQDLLIESVKASLQAGQKQSGRSPKILVIGAVSGPSALRGGIADITVVARTLRQGCCPTGQGCWYP